MLFRENLFVIIIVLTFTNTYGIKITERPSGYNFAGGSYNENRQTSLKPQTLRHTSNGYRLSLPKNKKAINRVPIYLQDVVDYTQQKPIPTGTDAIRIVEPPHYFQEQKHRFQKSPNNHYGEPKNPQNYYGGSDIKNIAGYYKDLRNPQSIYGDNQQELQKYFRDQSIFTNSFNQQPKLSKRPQHQALISSLNSAIRYPIESTYNGPEYMPLAALPPQPPSPRPHTNKFVTAHHSIAINHPKPTPTYLGIQTPSSNSLRAQVLRFKEQQKHVFEDDNDERPVTRSKTKSVKRKPKPSQSLLPSATLSTIYYNDDDDDAPTGYDYENNRFYKKPKESASYSNDKAYAVVEHTTPDPPYYETSTFTPYKVLASTRHRKRVTHKKKDPISDENTKERLRTEQKHTVYSEQGFEDSEYDHGDEERHAKRKKKYRQKRDTTEKNFEDDNVMDEMIEELPITLNMMGNDGERLTGKALITHITHLLKNASKYIPDDESPEEDSVLLEAEQLEKLLTEATNFTLTKADESTPQSNENFPHKHSKLFDIAADPLIRYSKAIEASPYRKLEAFSCEENQPNFEQNSRKKKLGNIGNQLDCTKNQLFGKNPFSNRFFSNSFDVQSNIDNKSPADEKSSTSSFRSSLVYDDVMNAIKSALGAEKLLSAMNSNIKLPKKKKKNQYDSLSRKNNERTLKHLESFAESSSTLPVIKKPNNKQSLPIKNIDSVVFDISKFIPKAYMIGSNGKIYRIKYRPNKRISAFLTNNSKVNKMIPLNPPPSRRRSTDGHKKIKSKQNTGVNRRDGNVINKKSSPEAQKFSHENGMTRFGSNQRYQT